MKLLRRAFRPIIRPVLHCYFRFARPLTLGAFGMVIDGTGRVFLIKHSYLDGWHLPGGGVEPGESVHSALARELAEEGNIALNAPAVLKSMHFNRRSSRRDHVGFYLIEQFSQTAPKQPDHEIAESGFFPLDRLPRDTTPATLRRIAEIFQDEPASPYW